MTSAEYIFVVYIKTLYTICYHLYNLKNVKNTQGGVAKSNTPLWVFSMFLKLYKWYQIAQSITYIISAENITGTFTFSNTNKHTTWFHVKTKTPVSTSLQREVHVVVCKQNASRIWSWVKSRFMEQNAQRNITPHMGTWFKVKWVHDLNWIYIRNLIWALCPLVQRHTKIMFSSCESDR